MWREENSNLPQLLVAHTVHRYQAGGTSRTTIYIYRSFFRSLSLALSLSRNCFFSSFYVYMWEIPYVSATISLPPSVSTTISLLPSVSTTISLPLSLPPTLSLPSVSNLISLPHCVSITFRNCYCPICRFLFTPGRCSSSWPWPGTCTSPSPAYCVSRPSTPSWVRRPQRRTLAQLVHAHTHRHTVTHARVRNTYTQT